MTMAHALRYAALGTAFTFLMTALGAAAVFLPAGGRQRDGRAMLGFAAGVMTAASFWSLLLPAIEQAREGMLPAWLPAAAGTAMGVGVLAALDAAMPGACGWGESGEERRSALLFAAITLHNIPEGMAVGLAWALAADGEGAALAAALTLGIGIQNFPEGAAIALPLRQMGRRRRRAFLAGALSGAVEPLFGVAAVPAAGIRGAMPWMLSFAAGAMLYVVVEELIPGAGGRRGTLGFAAGFLTMMILDVALG